MEKENFMRLVFLFMSRGSAVTGSTPDNYKARGDCDPFYNHHNTEGYFQLVEDFLNDGIFDDAYIFYESNRGPGMAYWVNHKNAHCEVIPEVRLVEKYITEDTVIWVRGGFKFWHDFLLKYKGKNWLVLYAANTGRGRWGFWDVILNDLDPIPRIDRQERLNYPFVKPIAESTFFYMDIPKKYDLCIGASYIYDKKGQFRAVEAIEIANEYGVEVKAIMPGSFRRSVHTVDMIHKVRNNPKLARQVEFTGFVDKNTLRKIFNQSTFFCQMGNHGQNDRGPLEAFACGCSVILRSPQYHAPLLVKSSWIARNAKELAAYLVTIKEEGVKSDPKYVSDLFKKKSGYKEVAYPLMQKLFSEMATSRPTHYNKKRILAQL